MRIIIDKAKIKDVVIYDTVDEALEGVDDALQKMVIDDDPNQNHYVQLTDLKAGPRNRLSRVIEVDVEEEEEEEEEEQIGKSGSR